MTKKEYMDMYDVVGAAMEVYNTLGRGMAEAIYQESLAKEFKLRGMDAEREKPLYSYYKGILLDKIYYADFYYKDIVIELKSVEEVVSDGDHHVNVTGLDELFPDILILALTVRSRGCHNKTGAAMLVQIGIEIGDP